METYDKLVEKWAPVLNEESAGVIKDSHRKAVTAVILENQERAFQDEAAQANMLTEAAPGNATSSAANWNPVLISLVRRALPNMMAYDVCGVQPLVLLKHYTLKQTQLGLVTLQLLCPLGLLVYLV